MKRWSMRWACSTVSPASRNSVAMSAGVRQTMGSGPATSRSWMRFQWYFHAGPASRSFTMATPPGSSAAATERATWAWRSAGKWCMASQTSTTS